MMINDEFPCRRRLIQHLFQPGCLAFCTDIRIQNHKKSIAVFKPVGPLLFDFFRSIFEKVKFSQIQSGMASLVFMISNSGHQLTAVVNVLGIFKKTIPIITVVASVHQVTCHDVKCRVGPFAKRGVYQTPPSIETILSIPHVDERKRFGAGWSRGKFGELRPMIFSPISNGIHIGGIRFEVPQGDGESMAERVVDDVRSLQHLHVGFNAIQGLG